MVSSCLRLVDTKEQLQNFTTYTTPRVSITNMSIVTNTFNIQSSLISKVVS